MLVMMPGQTAWSAIVSICQHESGVAAQHMGHHVHQHQAESSNDRNSDSSRLGGTDLDCSVCHAGFSSIAGNLVFTAVITATSYDAGITRISLLTPLPERPERPQWRHLA